MDMLKREWKSILVLIWLVCITLYLYNMRTNINRVQVQSDKIADTLEAVEGVVVSVDSEVVESNKRMKRIEAQVNYIVKKVRRR